MSLDTTIHATETTINKTHATVSAGSRTNSSSGRRAARWFMPVNLFACPFSPERMSSWEMFYAPKKMPSIAS
jgi:hypothetical protein